MINSKDRPVPIAMNRGLFVEDVWWREGELVAVAEDEIVWVIVVAGGVEMLFEFVGCDNEDSTASLGDLEEVEGLGLPWILGAAIEAGECAVKAGDESCIVESVGTGLATETMEEAVEGSATTLALILKF